MPEKKGSTKSTSRKKNTKQTAKSSAKSAPKKEASAAKSSGNAAAVKQPRRREIGAVVCLFLAVFSFLGYFSSDGWFIHFFRSFLAGLVGRGFYLFPPALLLCAYILFFHRGRPVRLRLVCALLLPLVISAMLHLLGCKTEYEWSVKLLANLYADGSAADVSCCGGLLGGILAMCFGSMFGKVGASIVFIIVYFFFTYCC